MGQGQRGGHQVQLGVLQAQRHVAAVHELAQQAGGHHHVEAPGQRGQDLLHAGGGQAGLLGGGGGLRLEGGQAIEGAAQVDRGVQDETRGHLGGLAGARALERLLVEIDEVDLAKARGQRGQVQVVAVAGAQHGQGLPGRLQRQHGQARAVLGEGLPARPGGAVVLAVVVDQRGRQPHLLTRARRLPRGDARVDGGQRLRQRVRTGIGAGVGLRIQIAKERADLFLGDHQPLEPIESFVLRPAAFHAQASQNAQAQPLQLVLKMFPGREIRDVGGDDCQRRS